MKFSSYSIVSMVVNEATEQFSPLFQPVQERMDILKQYCKAIDDIIAQFDGEELECTVDEITKTTSITLVLTEVIIENKTDPFHQLVQRSLSTTIESAGSDSIRVKMVFPSLWDHV